MEFTNTLSLVEQDKLAFACALLHELKLPNETSEDDILYEIASFIKRYKPYEWSSYLTTLTPPEKPKPNRRQKLIPAAPQTLSLPPRAHSI